MGLKFTKMQAYGNDYIFVDNIHQEIDNPSSLAIKISDRHYGVGSDGLVLLCKSDNSDFRMRMFNPDGTEGEMCGNALRGLAKFAYHYHFTDKTAFQIETLGGRQEIQLEINNGEVTNIEANIGKPELRANQIPVCSSNETFIQQHLQVEDREFLATAISWGNPHCVIFIDSLSDFNVEKYGYQIEHMIEVFPKKTNVTFVQIVNPGHLKIREWERGTGETLGCGTGCCSAVVAGNILGKCERNVEVEQIGGILKVVWDENDEMHMRGSSDIVFEGELFT
jgi:diaminopimelate epimerase